MNENYDIFIHISLKFVPKGPADNNLTLHGPDNILTPNRRQATTRTNVDTNLMPYGFDELRHFLFK